MFSVQAGKRIDLKNILFLADFSEPSSNALPFASMIARSYGAKVTALHVLVPSAYLAKDKTSTVADDQEDLAKEEMERVEAELTGLPRETVIERSASVWPVLARILKECEVSLIVLGTHGRTGLNKASLGSFAEKVFRRTMVPVLTVGPAVRSSAHSGGRFHCILFATDFNTLSEAAAHYAVSLAQENQARLVLVHILPEPKPGKQSREETLSVAEAMHQLGELVPADAELWCRPEFAVEHGDAGSEILSLAERCGADLIVLGVRGLDALTGDGDHAQRPTSYEVVAHAPCPVLTVRG
jgi:nucleotide-binding universal stress UspA family protein